MQALISPPHGGQEPANGGSLGVARPALRSREMTIEENCHAGTGDPSGVQTSPQNDGAKRLTAYRDLMVITSAFAWMIAYLVSFLAESTGHAQVATNR